MEKQMLCVETSLIVQQAGQADGSKLLQKYIF